MALVLSSCVKEETYDNTPQGNFEALWQMIDQHYCFLSYKHEAIGLDWTEVHQRYAQRIKDTMNSAQLFEVLTDMLAELRDGHVNLYTAGDVGRYWSWYEDYPSNYSQSLQDAYLGTDYRMAAGLYYRILDDNTGYLVCRSFGTAFGDGNIDEALYWLRSCNGLILDVRDNSGGTLTYAQMLAGRFTNERLLVGYIRHKTGTGHDDFSEPQAEYLEPSTRIRWQKPCVVLTNRRCYSATNEFIRDMQYCPLVTIMGDKTGGGGGLPFSSELPNGWSVRFSACPSFDAEMQQIEFGIEPDIYVSLSDTDIAQGTDTMIEAARRLLRGE